MKGRIALMTSVLALAAAPNPVAAQDSLPLGIATAFRQTYPGARILHVSRERRGGKVVFEVESQDGPTRRDLLYDLTGRTLEIEEVIPVDSVPAAIHAAVRRDVAGGRLVGAERVTRDTVILYEVEVRVGTRSRFLTYDPAGTRRE